MTNVDPKKQAELDQAIQSIGDTLAPMYWNLYKGCIREGFKEDQAFRIVLTYVGKPFET